MSPSDRNGSGGEGPSTRPPPEPTASASPTVLEAWLGDDEGETPFATITTPTLRQKVEQPITEFEGLAADAVTTLPEQAASPSKSGAPSESARPKASPARSKEVEFEFSDSESGTATQSVGAGEMEFGAEDFENSLELPAPVETAPPVKGDKEGDFTDMQSGFEVTDYYADFDAGSAFASSAAVTYEGLSLAVRKLFSPVEELLHEATGDADALSLLEQSSEQILSGFAAELPLLAQSQGSIPFEVRPTELLCDGRPVLRDVSQGRSGLYRLHAAGVQSLVVVAGVSPRQAKLFAELLLEPTAEGALAVAQSDVVSLWWAHAITHIRLSVLETFDEVEALPETGLTVIEVDDQSREQMGRLRSRLLAAVPRMGQGSHARRAIRSFIITQDDLRAARLGLFEGGAKLLGREGERHSALPFPERADEMASLSDQLDEDFEKLDARYQDAMFASALHIQAEDRNTGIIHGILARPARMVRSGNPEGAVKFLLQIGRWSERAKSGSPEHDVGALILAAAAAPPFLLPLLTRLSTTPERWKQAIALVAILPCAATCSLGAALHMKLGGPALAELFALRLEEDLAEILSSIEVLDVESLVGLVRGASDAQLPQLGRLITVLRDSPHPELRVAIAESTARLAADSAKGIWWRFLRDDDPRVRMATLKVIEGRPDPAAVGPFLERLLGDNSFRNWRFEDQRRAVFAALLLRGPALSDRLMRIAALQNQWKREPLSRLRAAALIGLAALGSTKGKRLATKIAASDERRVVLAAAQSVLGATEVSGTEELTQRFVLLTERFSSFDRELSDEPTGVAGASRSTAGGTDPMLSLGNAMSINDLLSGEGDRVQVLGCALCIELSRAIHWARLKKSSLQQFTVATGRAALIAGALCEVLEGSAALQTFDSQFFVSARRLRLPIDVFIDSEPLRETFKQLRVHELLFAESPTRSDIVELIYALETALRIEREPWLELERTFTRIRLRELSLIRESWGRPAGIEVDINANAARLFGMVHLWLRDASDLADDAELFPRRTTRLVRELVDSDLEGEALRPGLCQVKDNPGDGTLYLAHAVLLSCLFARRLGFSRDAMERLIRIALHHSLGLTTLPQSLQQDLGHEGGTEALELAAVPAYSVARLSQQAMESPEDKLMTAVAFESLAPLSACGKRGLAALGERPPCFHAAFLSVVDRFIYLTSRFPEREGQNADGALQEMLRDPELNRGLVEHLANLAQVLPLGSAVRLRDGSAALVVSSPQEISRESPLILRPLREASGTPAGAAVLGPRLMFFESESDRNQFSKSASAAGTDNRWCELAPLLLRP